MSMRVAQAQLQDAVKKLNARWEKASSSWSDVASQRFEETYLEPMRMNTARACGAMQRMAEVISRVTRDCE